MAARAESPLISVYEFCYAAGLGCRIAQVPQEEAGRMIAAESFADFKEQIQRRCEDAGGMFASFPDGERLHSLIAGCRHRGELDEDARALFEMGFQTKL